MNRIGFGALGVALLAVGCSGGPRGTGGELGRTQDDITHGSNDTTHQAVMFLYNKGATAACSGTVVAVKGTTGFFLTAAHCMASATNTNLTVFQGDDQATSTTVYPGTGFIVHPSYQAQSGNNPAIYDFAIVKFNGAGGATPTMPFLTKTLDDLAAGSPVEIVGYGETSKSGAGTGVRRYVDNTLANSQYVSAVTALTLGYVQNSSTLGGACSGDSGGPVLYSKGGTQYVAGITSYGDQNCTQFGVSGRVSAVADWVQSYIDGTVINPTQTCAECEQSSSSGVGTCASTWTDCTNDTDCNALLTCLQACASGDTTCSNACFTAHTTGSTVYGKIGDCLCNTGCKTECASDPLCQKPACGFSFTDATCTTCVEGACCTEDQACYDDTACSACATSTTPDPSCNNDTKLAALRICYQKNCATECGLTPAQCGFSAQNATCQSCFEQSCCAATKACAEDVDCSICATSASPPASCAQNQLSNDFNTCLGTNCASQCGGSATDGGVGGGGAGGAAGAGGGAAAGGTGGGTSAGGSGAVGTGGSGGFGVDGGVSGSGNGSGNSGSSGSCSVSAEGRGNGQAWLLLVGLVGLLGARRRRR